jgi:hypothetical protein
MAEPEPDAALTRTRFIAALPGLPRAAAAELDENRKVTPAAVDARAAGVTSCAFCLVPAVSALGVYALELLVDGTRWLDLCDPHAYDVRRHLDPPDDAALIAEWDRQHGGQSAAAI